MAMIATPPTGDTGNNDDVYCDMYEQPDIVTHSDDHQSSLQQPPAHGADAVAGIDNESIDYAPVDYEPVDMYQSLNSAEDPPAYLHILG